MPIHVTTSTIQSLSNKTFVDLLSTTGVVYANQGNSNQWNSSYSTVAAQSANNASVFTTVQANSATSWNYQGTDIKALTGAWQNTYTTFAEQSASNASVYSTVNANSASVWNYQGTDIKALTANWQNTYNNFAAQSANNASVYSTVNANSATWGTGGSGSTPIISYTRWQHTAAAATSVYSIPGAYAGDSAAYRVTINAIIQDPATYTINNVADTITFDAVPPLSADIVIIESTISGSVTQTMTANWQSVYATVQANSAKWSLYDFVVACSDETTALTTGDAKITFRMAGAMQLSAVRASVSTAPVGSLLIVDINKNGSSILSTKLSIDSGEKTSTTAASAAVISDANLTDDAEITIDVDQIGSSTAGAGLKVTFIGTRA